MLRLSKKAEYALMALKDLASRPEAEAASAREIAERYGIPIELMAKVLQRLVRQDLLASHHGTRGGYQLSRSARLISVADVIEAIDGPVMVSHRLPPAPTTTASSTPRATSVTPCGASRTRSSTP